MKINFQKIKDNALIPSYGTKYSAGADLTASLDENISIESGQIVIVPTGIVVQIPVGFFGMLCPRSGLAVKYGLTLLNSPGIIDADYRGEIKVIMINHSTTSFTIENGMRIAQLVITPFQKVEFIESEDLTHTSRGIKGFGSTGIV